MMWRNGAESFGIVSRALHWAVALMVLVMLSLGLRISSMEPGLANLWLYSLHKSLGLVTLGLMVARVVWHVISPPPRPMGGGWQVVLARWVHRGIYALMFAIPLSGWVASSATGIEVMVFDRWVVPAIAPVSALWEERGFALHDVLGKVLMAVIALHMAAALKREMEGDGTLTRMIRGRAR